MSVATKGAPLVSVIVPAWNSEKTLAETLRSVAAQTYRTIEIIIVDDGSTDATAQVAREFCAAEPRARLLSKENGGVASARNRGIAEAAGEWIAPIDADDLWHPTRIERMLATALGAEEMPGFVYCWPRFVDRQGKIIGSGPRRAYRGRALHQLAFVNAVGCGSGLLLSRKAVSQVGGYDESLRARNAQGCEDMMIQLLIASDFPVAAVPEHLVGWRQHDTNMSGDFDQIMRSARLVFERLGKERPALPRKVIRWAEARRAFDVAENRAVAGKPVAVLASLLNALRLDPAGSGAMLGYRLLRSLVRRTRRRIAPATPAFFDVDPAADIHGDPYELRWLSALVKQIEGARLERLARLDAGQAN